MKYTRDQIETAVKAKGYAWFEGVKDYDVNIVAGTFNINALTTCSVIQDGIPVMENASMQLTSVKKVQLTEQYEEHVELSLIHI